VNSRENRARNEELRPPADGQRGRADRPGRCVPARSRDLVHHGKRGRARSPFEDLENLIAPQDRVAQTAAKLLLECVRIDLGPSTSDLRRFGALLTGGQQAIA